MLPAARQVVSAIEALDPGRLCADYWAGKRQRDAAIAGGGAAAGGGGAAAAAGAAGPPAGAARRKGGRGGGGGGGEARGDESAPDPEAAFRGNQ
jgi:hypothetical protein